MDEFDGPEPVTLQVTISLPWSNVIDIPVKGLYFGHPNHEWTNIELVENYDQLGGLVSWLNRHTKGREATWEWGVEGEKTEINLSEEFTVKEIR